MKTSPLIGPTTTVFNSDEFADSLRNGKVCIPFLSLELSGPEGSFAANGLLVSRGSELILEYSPIPHDGSSIPKPAKTGFKITYNPSDFWSATGITLHGLNLHLQQLMPPYCEYAIRNDHVCLEQRVRHIEMLPSKLSPEHIEFLEKISTKYGIKNKGNSDAQPITSEIRAYLANTRLRIKNNGVKTEISHPFFSYKTGGEKSNCLVGDVGNWLYCFTQESDDIILNLRSKENFSSPTRAVDRFMLDGLLSAFAFMHGTSAIPWRTKHHRDDCPDQEQFIADFAPPNEGPKPIGGRLTFCFGEVNSPAPRMFNLMAGYFSAGEVTTNLMRSYHWQLVEAAAGSEVSLHKCLHLCAIFEGVAKLLLEHRFGWSKSALRKASAITRFQAVCSGFGLAWDDLFKPICSEWKKLRDALAHGSFFGSDGAWEEDLFSLSRRVSGGVLMLMLSDAGWKDSFDLWTIDQTSHLYY